VRILDSRDDDSRDDSRPARSRPARRAPSSTPRFFSASARAVAERVVASRSARIESFAARVRGGGEGGSAITDSVLTQRHFPDDRHESTHTWTSTVPIYYTNHRIQIACGRINIRPRPTAATRHPWRSTPRASVDLGVAPTVTRTTDAVVVQHRAMHADDADADRRVVELVVVTIANPHLWPNSETMMIMMTHTRGADDVARRGERARDVDRDERVDKHQ